MYSKGIFKCACSRKTLILVKMLVLFCCNKDNWIFFLRLLSGVIFPLFFLVKCVIVSHSLIGFLGVQGVLK